MTCYEEAFKFVDSLGEVPVNEVEGAAIDEPYWVVERVVEGEFITRISPLSERNQLQDIKTMT